MRPLRLHPLDYAAACAFLAYAASAVVTPICLLILASELDFSFEEAGFIEAMRGVLMVVVLVLSVFAAGRWGKARVLGMSSLVMGAGMGAYALSPTYGAVLMSIGLVGMGSGMIEGLLNPIIQDVHPDDSGRYLNILNAFWSIGVLLTMLLGGELLTQGVSWRWIAAGIGVLSVLSGLLFLALAGHAPAASPLPLGEVGGQMISTLRAPRYWTFSLAMFFAGAAEGGFTYWSASYIQLYYDGQPREGGIGAAAFATGMILGRLGGGWVVRQSQLWRLLMISALAGVVVSTLVPMVSGLFAAYIMLFAAGLTVACMWPSIQSYAADRVAVDSTSLFIFLSCAGIPGFAFASWLMGRVAESLGLEAGFYLLPVFFLLLAAVLAAERLRPPAAPSPRPPDTAGGT